MVCRAGFDWQVERVPDEDPLTVWRKLTNLHPGFYAELRLVGYYGERLAAIWRGEIGAESSVSPVGPLALTEHLYQDSSFLRCQNLLVQAAISAALQELPPGAGLRVLELAAGTGGLTAYVLTSLSRDLAKYVFTDVSEAILGQAKEKFREFPRVEYHRLDVNGDVEAQGFAAHSFDLILASGLSQIALDPGQVLEKVKWLLASEGLFASIEEMRPIRWFDFVEGLMNPTGTPVGGSFPHRPLRVADWRRLLQANGLDFACPLPDGEEKAAQHGVILARGPRLEAESAAGGAGSDQREPVEEGTWLVLADRSGTGQKLTQLLTERGERCIIVLPAESYRRLGPSRFQILPGRMEDMQRLLDDPTVRQHFPLRGIVHLWSLDAPSFESSSGDSVAESLNGSCLGLVHLVRALTDLAAEKPPRLWIVTRGAESVGRRLRATSPAQAAVWGLNRVIVNELPRFQSTVVDLGSESSEKEIRSLGDELLHGDREDELALRGTARYVHRYVRSADEGLHQEKRYIRGGEQSFRLEASRLGTLDGLQLRAAGRRAPGQGQVEIEVAAAGLNFSDIMKALGLYPGLSDGAVPMGIECSGRVTSVGEGVDEFRPGEEVIAVAPFSLGAFVTTPACLVVHKPDAMTLEEAATIPIAFLTAQYALQHMGRMSAGERVLIHSATGGVGLAAIQLARQAGAQIFATAGTEEKRQLLRSLGIEYVMDSRSTSFADEVLEVTGGEGVDLVLNSLAGDAIRMGISALAENGRFLEIGKRDIYGDRRVGLRAFRKNLSFIAIDLDREFRRRPGLIGSLFRDLMGDFRSGTLFPLPYRAFPLSNVGGAFRYMAKAKHVGKVIVSLQEQQVPVIPSSEEKIRFPEDATYLITGGLGGFGLKTAQWLVENGARHLVLTGRRGIYSPEGQDAVERMRRAGARVLVAQADVSNRDQVAGLLEEIDRSLPPLRGVFHAAMVLRDSLLPNMGDDEMREVWLPKVIGACNLHALTSTRPLDHFVLYSSMSAALGTGGQGNYAAANAFLDSLALYRQAQGLPGLSVGWGYLGEVGVVAQQKDIARRFEAMGIQSFAPGEGLNLLGRFLLERRAQAGVMRVDWRRWSETQSAASVSTRFEDLMRSAESGQDGQKRSGSALRAAILDAHPSERRGMMETSVREQVARVLGASPEQVDVEKSLSDLGLDSLMAVELRNWIERDLRLNLPAVELLRGPSVLQLSDLLLEQISRRDSPEPATEPMAPSSTEAGASGLQDLLEKVDDMSHADLDALLDSMERRSQSQ
jgi:NADPH:quinone reductase-like Zn-dependent oxidoreductase/SAM-dependent methyltransferase/acyl carrier protein